MTRAKPAQRISRDSRDSRRRTALRLAALASALIWRVEYASADAWLNVSSAPVPEPSVALLFTLGLAGLTVACRRRDGAARRLSHRRRSR